MPSSEIVEFSYETTTVDVDTKTSHYDRLSKITIFRNDSECTPVKNFVFEQSESPFRGKRGGLLNKISEVSADGKNKQTLFLFDYEKRLCFRQIIIQVTKTIGDITTAATTHRCLPNSLSINLEATLMATESRMLRMPP